MSNHVLLNLLNEELGKSDNMSSINPIIQEQE